ncbi:MAG: hypothetical protein IAE90_07015 [Ignavibacteria bacterium]|nr:hypothetical protein [Ignavibacteria bacterium]
MNTINSLDEIIKIDSAPLTEGIEKSLTKNSLKMVKEGVPPPPPQPIQTQSSTANNETLKK